MSEVSKEIKLDCQRRSVLAIAEAIRMLKETNEGKLYAMVCTVVSLDVFNAIVRILVKANLVQKRGHQLKWIGGEPVKPVF